MNGENIFRLILTLLFLGVVGFYLNETRDGQLLVAQMGNFEPIYFSKGEEAPTGRGMLNFLPSFFARNPVPPRSDSLYAPGVPLDYETTHREAMFAPEVKVPGEIMVSSVDQRGNIIVKEIIVPVGQEERYSNIYNKQRGKKSEANYYFEGWSDSDLEYTASPNDPAFVDKTLWGLYSISAPKAWGWAKSLREVVVGVLDSGVDYNHEDLASNIWINKKEIPDNNIDDDKNGYVDDRRGWDFADNDNDPIDPLGHGTHVAGIIAAVGNNQKGTIGVGWQTKIAPLKTGTIKAPDVFSAIQAIQYAVKMGFPVLNMSFATPIFSKILFDVIKEANKAGVLVVASTNNKNTDDDRNPYYPVDYDLPNIISVLAVNKENYKKDDSNFGKKTIDLGAPGDMIVSTVPKGDCLYCAPTGYNFSGGASMAAPHVAGALALGISTISDYRGKHLAVRQALLDSVDLIKDLADKTITGGKLNVEKFIKKLKNLTPPKAQKRGFREILFQIK